MEKALVTGGCGFIGSHLVDYLVGEGSEVDVLDDLSAGHIGNIEKWESYAKCRFVRKDLLTDELSIPTDCETIYHLAANPDVRIGSSSPKIHFDQNIVATYRLLEATRKSNAEKFVFSSTSTVYGEAEQIPTSEDYGPLKPISTYGGSKLACEALISSYSYTYGIKSTIFRLANIIGSRSTHGIIFDLLQKLRNNPIELEILGDGSQTKSYLHVQDCVEGILTGNRRSHSQVSIFNTGSEDQINVMKIAEIVCREAGFPGVKYKLYPATSDGRGWLGDVRFMRLDVSRLKSLGWSPKMSSEEAVTRSVRELLSPEPIVLTKATSP
jgi:UDP-glucose 4-epimerase